MIYFACSTFFLLGLFIGGAVASRSWRKSTEELTALYEKNMEDIAKLYGRDS